jgi:hypothetical protein
LGVPSTYPSQSGHDTQPSFAYVSFGFDGTSDGRSFHARHCDTHKRSRRMLSWLPGMGRSVGCISCYLTRRPYLNSNQTDGGAPPLRWRTAAFSPPPAPPQTPEMSQPGACPRHSPASHATIPSPCTPETHPSGSLVHCACSEESIRPFTRVQCTGGGQNSIDLGERVDQF